MDNQKLWKWILIIFFTFWMITLIAGIIKAL